MFTRTLTFNLKIPNTFHISDFQFIFKVNEALQALCPVRLNSLVSAELVRNFALRIVDELHGQNLFFNENKRISSEISADIYNMVKDDPLLQNLIEQLDLSVAQQVVALISLSTSTHPFSVVFSLHV